LSGAFDLSSIANPVPSISARALQLPDRKDITPLTVEQRDHVILTARSRATFTGKGTKEVTRVKLQAVYMRVVVGFSIGLRIGEVLALLWEDVDLEAGVMDVHDGGSDGTTKTRAGTRQVPMTRDLRKVLQARRDRMGGAGYVFGSPADQLKPWDASNVQDDLADLREASKVAGFAYHVCRHTFAVIV
jgi:integrase